MTTSSLHPRHHGGYHDYNLFFDPEAAPPLPIAHERAGTLSIPSGRMAVCYLAGWGCEADRRVWEVPAGRYDVDLATYQQRPAMARVRFGPERPVRWVAALGTDARGVPLTVGVTGSSLGFVDAAQAPLLAARSGEHLEADTAAVESALEANGGNWAAWWFEPDTESPMLVVRAGLGDGAYPAFWGETAEGRRVAFVIDFRTVYQDEPDAREDFSGRNLAGADLQGAMHAEARFVCTDLSGANLAEAWLTEADLTSANLAGAILRGAHLCEADCTGASFAGADLTAADLTDATLDQADLTGAVARSADFTDASLHAARAAGADLREADLTGADLSKADLRGANLRDAILTDVYLPGAQLAGADLTGATLEGIDWSEVDLTDVELPF